MKSSKHLKRSSNVKYKKNTAEIYYREVKLMDPLDIELLSLSDN